MKYCGVVTDESWTLAMLEPYIPIMVWTDEVEYKEDMCIFPVEHSTRRIYTDEVPMADVETLYYFRMNRGDKLSWAMSKSFYQHKKHLIENTYNDNLLFRQMTASRPRSSIGETNADN